jgi:hypothetical protein
MSTSGSLRFASRGPASTPFVSFPRLAAAVRPQRASKLRTSLLTQRTTDGAATMLGELDSVCPAALPVAEAVLLEDEQMRGGGQGPAPLCVCRWGTCGGLGVPAFATAASGGACSPHCHSACRRPLHPCPPQASAGSPGRATAGGATCAPRCRPWSLRASPTCGCHRPLPPSLPRATCPGSCSI